MKTNITGNLKNFLLEAQCLEKFVRNISPSFPAEEPIRVIGEAFIWDETPEGRDFWKNLNKAYYKRMHL